MDYLMNNLENIGSFFILSVFWGGVLINLLYNQTAIRYLESKRYPRAALVLALAILWQATGATLIMIPSMANGGAFLLITFTLVASLQFYQFWKMKGIERYINIIFFLSNLGVIGGLLLLLNHIQNFGGYFLDRCC